MPAATPRRSPHADPIFGDPNAPPGSPDWAMRWRMDLQNEVKKLPLPVETIRKAFEQGQTYRAWTLLKRPKEDGGKPFADFDTFCSYREPWGLGMDPVKFRAYLAAELGDKAADLVAGKPSPKPGAPEGNKNAAKGDGKNNSAANAGLNTKARRQGERKEEYISAVLRAPEVVQQMYRDDRITQADAAKMGPKKPTPEQAAKVAQARQELEKISPALPKPEARKQAKRIVQRHLGGQAPPPLELVKRACARLTANERAELRRWLDAEEK